MQLPDKNTFIILSGISAFLLLLVIMYYQNKWKKDENDEINQKIFCNLKKEVVYSKNTCDSFGELADVSFGKQFRTCFWCEHAVVNKRNHE